MPPAIASMKKSTSGILRIFPQNPDGPFLYNFEWRSPSRYRTQSTAGAAPNSGDGNDCVHNRSGTTRPRGCFVLRIILMKIIDCCLLLHLHRTGGISGSDIPQISARWVVQPARIETALEHLVLAGVARREIGAGRRSLN